MAYDVFISFKNSGKDGKATPDAVAARKVYEALKGAGIKAFFSEESLAEQGKGHFAKSIEKALESARVLVLVASCREHIESQWVEAEWDSFAQDVRSGNKQGEMFILNCGDLKPANLPLFLRRQQMFPENGLEKLIRFVINAVPSAPTLDSYIQLALHCFHPEKKEDKVYLVTVQQGSSAATFNVTAHWGARSSKRLSSQIKAINVTQDVAKTEMEKAMQEKHRGGYAPADHSGLLTDEARAFLAASLGLTEVVVKAAQPEAVKSKAVEAKKPVQKPVTPATTAAKTNSADPANPTAKRKAGKPDKAVAPAEVAVPAKATAKAKPAGKVQALVAPITAAPKTVAVPPKAVKPVKAAAKSKAVEPVKGVPKAKTIEAPKASVSTKKTVPVKEKATSKAVVVAKTAPAVAVTAQKANAKTKLTAPASAVTTSKTTAAKGALPASKKPSAAAKKDSAPAIAFKTLCISGKLPSGLKKADYEAPLRAAGYELVDDVVKGLSYLVLAEPGFVSSKSEKAKKMGVKVISEEQLKKLVK